MTQPDRLYSKEQIEEWATKRADDAGRLSRQLLDTMRENQRLREVLEYIAGSLRNSENDETLLAIRNVCDTALEQRNKDSVIATKP